MRWAGGTSSGSKNLKNFVKKHEKYQLVSILVEHPVIFTVTEIYRAGLWPFCLMPNINVK